MGCLLALQSKLNKRYTHRSDTYPVISVRPATVRIPRFGPAAPGQSMIRSTMFRVTSFSVRL